MLEQPGEDPKDPHPLLARQDTNAVRDRDPPDTSFIRLTVDFPASLEQNLTSPPSPAPAQRRGYTSCKCLLLPNHLLILFSGCDECPEGAAAVSSCSTCTALQHRPDPPPPGHEDTALDLHSYLQNDLNLAPDVSMALLASYTCTVAL